MKFKLISCILWIFLFLSSLCLAQMDSPGDSPEAISSFSGFRFYSRTMGSGDKEEKVQQWVLPVFLGGQVTDNFQVRIYQTISGAELREGASLSGLENTRVRSSFSFFENAIITYLGLSLPVGGVAPEMETARLDSLLYREALQFGVSRLTEGFDLETGFVFAQPFGKLSLGFGAGYAFRGSYDRLSQDGESVEYDPGDAINATAGLLFRNRLASLNGRALYIHYANDEIGEGETLKSGDELSFLASAKFRFDPPVLTLLLSDTIKDKSDKPEEISISNLFTNRLNGSISIAYPLFGGAIIPRIQTDMKVFFNDGDTNSKVASFEGGFQLILIDNFILDISSGLITGDMDGGETGISGFDAALVISYSF